MPFKKRNIRYSARKKTVVKKTKNYLKKFLRFQGLFEKNVIDNVKQVLSRWETREVVVTKIHEAGFDARKRKRKIKSWIISGIFLSLGLGVLFFTFSLYAKNFSKVIEKEAMLEILGEDIPKTSNGNTNILLLGIGGIGHDGMYLTDTIILASINEDNKIISMLSLPRDFYVDYEVNNQKRSGRINQVFRDNMNYWKYREEDTQKQRYLSMQSLEKTIENVLHQEIHRYAIVDFKGFTEVVDALGGIEIMVEKRLYDDQYPGENWTYATFVLEKGSQILNGETALKYARTRHGNSDFDRSKRQKQVITAIKDKATSKEFLTHPNNIRSLLSIIQDNFWTDISWGEMITLGNLASKIQRDNILTYELNDNPESGTGGFLVTPSRELYGGAFVLVPFLNLEPNPYDQIQFFSSIISNHPTLLNNQPPISIYNASSKEGIAGNTAQHILRYGIKTKMIDNAEGFEDTTKLIYSPTTEQIEMVSILQSILNMPFEVRSENEIDEGIVIIVGEDFSLNKYTGSLLRRPMNNKSSF